MMRTINNGQILWFILNLFLVCGFSSIAHSSGGPSQAVVVSPTNGSCPTSDYGLVGYINQEGKPEFKCKLWHFRSYFRGNGYGGQTNCRNQGYFLNNQSRHCSHLLLNDEVWIGSRGCPRGFFRQGRKCHKDHGSSQWDMETTPTEEVNKISTLIYTQSREKLKESQTQIREAAQVLLESGALNQDLSSQILNDLRYLSSVVIDSVEAGEIGSEPSIVR